MAWEKQIVGYTIKRFSSLDNPLIPTDAVYLTTSGDSVHTYGSKFHGGKPIPFYVYHFKIPVYKKVRIKKQKQA